MKHNLSAQKLYELALVVVGSPVYPFIKNTPGNQEYFEYLATIDLDNIENEIKCPNWPINNYSYIAYWFYANNVLTKEFADLIKKEVYNNDFVGMLKDD